MARKTNWLQNGISNYWIGFIILVIFFLFLIIFVSNLFMGPFNEYFSYLVDEKYINKKQYELLVESMRAGMPYITQYIMLISAIAFVIVTLFQNKILTLFYLKSNY